MRHLVRVIVLVVLLSGAAGLASHRAQAALPPCPDTQFVSIQGTHFVVTYNDDPTAPGGVSHAEAGAVLSAAERAYAAFVGMGFAPLAGQTEIDIEDLTAQKVASVYCGGAFIFDASTISDADLAANVAADVFGQFVLAQGSVTFWLAQGLAQWGAWKSVGYPANSTGSLGPWELPLDCNLTASDRITCSKTDQQANLALSRWPFYEYLAEKFGVPFIIELIRDAAGNNALTALQTALGAHGTTLATEYNAFTTKLLVGGWAATPLNTALPPMTGEPIVTGAATGDTPTAKFGVDHLATKYVQIDRGDGKSDHKCYAATLTITVDVPAGASSQPVFYWAAANNAPVPLTGSGSTMSVTVPWDTCTWTTHGYLSLPNASTTLNGALFNVSTHLSVSTTETTASPPTLPSNTYGNPADTVSAQGTAPAITLLGPQVMKVKSTATSLTVVVQSTDQGLLSASLGSSVLGKQAIVAGTNKLTFKISPGAGDKTLTLTPLSSDGTVTGAAATSKVSVVATAQKLSVTTKPAKKKTAKRK